MEKMSFEEFKKWSGKNVKSYLPTKYKKVKPRFENMTKHDISYHGMIMRPENEQVSSVINLDMFYDRYLMGDDPDLLLPEMAEIVLTKPPIRSAGDVGALFDYKKTKKQLFIRVLNLEDAGDRLDSIPHRVEGEFVITYSIRFEYDSKLYGSALIDNDLLCRYGITLEQLHKDAVKNAAVIMPACFDSIKEISGKTKASIPEDIVIPESISSMLIVSDLYSKAGSAVLFYPNTLKKIAEKLGGDFYVIPYSEKCSIAFPAEYIDEIEEYLNFISITYDPDNDGNILSHNLYMYDSDEQNLKCMKSLK